MQVNGPLSLLELQVNWTVNLPLYNFCHTIPIEQCAVLLSLRMNERQPVFIRKLNIVLEEWIIKSYIQQSPKFAVVLILMFHPCNCSKLKLSCGKILIEERTLYISFQFWASKFCLEVIDEVFQLLGVNALHWIIRIPTKIRRELRSWGVYGWLYCKGRGSRSCLSLNSPYAFFSTKTLRLFKGTSKRAFVRWDRNIVSTKLVFSCS